MKVKISSQYTEDVIWQGALLAIPRIGDTFLPLKEGAVDEVVVKITWRATEGGMVVDIITIPEPDCRAVYPYLDPRRR